MVLQGLDSPDSTNLEMASVWPAAPNEAHDMLNPCSPSEIRPERHQYLVLLW
jgi:hypothetical protein